MRENKRENKRESEREHRERVREGEGRRETVRERDPQNLREASTYLRGRVGFTLKPQNFRKTEFFCEV